MKNLIKPLFLTAATAGVLLACAGAKRADAWTPPINISNPSSEQGNPKIRRGSGGSLHVVFRRKPDWQIIYRHRDSLGVWGPMERASVTTEFNDRADCIEDFQGRPHVFYMGVGAGEKLDIFHSVKNAGVWTVTQLTNTSNYDEDQPRTAIDSLGRIHLVYTQSAGGTGSIYHRIYHNGNWSSPTYLGEMQNPYYHRPDIAIAPDDSLHLVYIGLSSKTLFYRKYSAGVWQPAQVVGSTTNFFAYPKVAAPTSQHVLVVTFDQWDNARLYQASSLNGGASFGAFTYLGEGHYPYLCSDSSGSAHLVYQANRGASIDYRKWTAGAWTAPQVTSQPARWLGWPDIAVDSFGVVHIVYENSTDQPNNQVFYVSSLPDAFPPALVSEVQLTEGDAAIQLAWKNPADLDYQRTIIRFRTDRYPNNPTDGALLASRNASPGSNDSVNHINLFNGQRYYYALFAEDFSGNFSAAVQVSGVPNPTFCGMARTLANGSWVTLKNKVVSGIFPSDNCIYIQEPSRSSGIRVVHSGAGLAVGDRVDVSGNLDTRIVSGQPAERQIKDAAVTKVTTGAPPAPLVMGSRWVGGAGSPPLFVGVKDAVGLYNVGLLASVAGRVTSKLSTSIWVDDGSALPDLTGRIGVAVRCPDTNPPVNVGDYVLVTGVIQGSVPVGWTESRRFLVMRNYNDLIKLAP